MATQMRTSTTEKKIRRMKFGLINSDENQKIFQQEFERIFDCQFEQVKMIDEIFKKKDDSLSIYNNGVRITSYPNQNQAYEIEQILTKEYNNFFEYSYTLMKSQDDPSQLLLGLDYESTARVEIKNGMRVFLPHFGLNTLIYEFKNMNNQMNEPVANEYVVEFNFFYEYNNQNTSVSDTSREKVLELERIIEKSFKNIITKYVEIQVNVTDKRGINDVKRLRPLLFEQNK